MKIAGFIAAAALGTAALGCTPQARDGDVEMLQVALTHVRTFVPEGAVQIEARAGVPDRSLRRAAERLQFGFGPVDDVIDCEGRGCKGRGDFRGAASVELLERSAVTAVVRLHMLQMQSSRGTMESRGDDVHLLIGRRVGDLARRQIRGIVAGTHR